MPSIRSLLITTALLVFVNWVLQVYRSGVLSGVLDPEFLVYGQTVIHVERIPVPDPKTAATIRGKTTNATTGSPVNDVQVIVRPIGRAEVAGYALSDTTGSYEIRVAPGLYGLVATRGRFVSTSYLDVAGLNNLALGDRQEVTVDLHMIPGAAIAGK